MLATGKEALLLSVWMRSERSRNYILTFKLFQNMDQYYVVGLVNYGFDCSGELPAVYVNLAAPEVKSFITKAFGENFC